MGQKAGFQVLRLASCVQLRDLTLSITASDPCHPAWDDITAMLLSIQSTYLEEVRLRIRCTSLGTSFQDPSTFDESSSIRLTDAVLRTRERCKTIVVTAFHLYGREESGMLDEEEARQYLPRLYQTGILKFRDNKARINVGE